jgi:hypothetical protein
MISRVSSSPTYQHTSSVGPRHSRQTSSSSLTRPSSSYGLLRSLSCFDKAHTETLCSTYPKALSRSFLQTSNSSRSRRHPRWGNLYNRYNGNQREPTEVRLRPHHWKGEALFWRCRNGVWGATDGYDATDKRTCHFDYWPCLSRSRCTTVNLKEPM